jgi:hypothetical protein
MPDIRNEIIDNLQVRGSVSGGSLGALARAVRVAMTAATAVTGIRVADSDNIEPGTSSFTFSWKGQIADTTINNFLFNKYQTSSARWRFVLGSSKTLSFIYTTGGVDVVSVTSTASAIVENNQENVYSISVTRETATTAGSAIFFVNGVPLGAPVSIAAAATADINNTASLFLGATLDATGRVACNFGEAIIYNRALSAAEVLSLYNNGPALADIGASQTAVYTSDFTVGIDGWTTGGSRTLTANQTINGTTGWLQLNRSSGGVTTWNMVRDLTFTAAQVAKNATIQVTLWRPAATTEFSYVAFDGQTGAVELPADTEVTVTIPLVVASTTLTLRATNSVGAADTTVANAQSIYIKSAVIMQKGITGWWDARDAQSDTGQILDSSGNKNHAMLPASGATVIGKPLSEARQVRGTNTWAASSSTQYVVGVNQNHLPTTAAWSTMDIIASGAVTVNIGDGSDVDRYGASIALSTGKNRVTLITPFNDGTNLKLTLTPTGSFTGTLETTATFIILED